MTWPHGFHVRRWKFKPGYSTLWHSRDEEEVILIQSGRLKYVWEGGELEMQAGDVLTMLAEADRIASEHVQVMTQDPVFFSRT